MLELILIVLSLISTALTGTLWLKYDGPIYILYYVLFILAFYVIYFLIFAILFALLGKTVNLNKKYQKPNRFYRYLMEMVMSFVTRVMNMRIVIKGKELLPEEPFFFVQNHRHGLDPMISVHVLKPRKMAWITKKENLKAPFAGRYMHRSCYLALDRNDPLQAVEVIKEATRLMKEEKLSIGVYPEGTRNKGEEGTLLEFKDGAFKTALRAKCPIVVSILKNTRAIGKRPHLKPTKIEFIILKVIPYEEYKSMKTNEISALVKEIMYEGLK